MPQQSIVIVGNSGGTNVGQSLLEAAHGMGASARLCDANTAYTGPRWWRRIFWRLGGRRASGMWRFAREVGSTVSKCRAGVLVTTGMVPVPRSTLTQIRNEGVRCLHYSTDDPWNPGHCGPWFLRTLPLYHHVFTPRRSNLNDFRTLGCKDVTYMPFGFDPKLFFPEDPVGEELEALRCELLFVGGADNDRAPILTALVRSGLDVALYGDYWDRYGPLRPVYRGRADPPLLRKASAAAAINLCLCRRANRDGHVMRSFEIPAAGGFMIVEDTEEHRELFGPEGECVLYFREVEGLLQKVRWSLPRQQERRRMARAAHRRIAEGGHTYADRLRSMLEQALGEGAD